jgi:PAS domain S-box-containing protein
MGEQPKDIAEEVKHLQRCMNDLVSLLALPAKWAGGEPVQIVDVLLDALLRMLQLDLVYAQLKVKGDHKPVERARLAQGRSLAETPQDIGEIIRESLGADPVEWPWLSRKLLRDRDIVIVPVRLGLLGEISFIVAGSMRPDFPLQTERLILSVAANHATIAVQEASLRTDQRQAAIAMDRLVAQRTAELALANTELSNEIAERKHTEEHLVRSEQMHRVILEAANDAVISMDDRGMIVLVNDAVERMFGYAPIELIGTPMTILMPASMRGLHEAGYKRYLTTGMRRLNWQGVEVTAVGKDGREFPVEVSFGEMTTDGHKTFTGFIRDISEKKAAEETLRNMQTRLSRAGRAATVGEFAAAIAHELNQPLAAVVANGHACQRWLLAEPPGLTKAREAAERIVRDGKEAGEILRRVRALFKKTALEKSRLDLNEVIHEVLRLLAGAILSEQISVTTDLADNLGTVEGDRVQLQQLLFNLLQNGIEAMEPVVDRPKELFIRSRLQGPEAALVEIRDRGVGMTRPDEVFDAFFTTKESGMGMGLAICRSIVDAHQGRIWATPAEGSGTILSFTLPVQHGNES